MNLGTESSIYDLLMVLFTYVYADAYRNGAPRRDNYGTFVGMTTTNIS